MSILRNIRTFCFARALGLCTNLKKIGGWAVVTGATDGIGKAYAEELAKLGINIILISRTESKLQTVASELEEKYKVETMIIVADFTREDIYEGIRSKLHGMDVGILVNNVGLSYDHPEFFLKVSNGEQYFMNLIHVNITSLTRMTKIVLPGMVERRKGVVINISSGSGVYPTPLLTVYSACKAYAEFFSEGLMHEYQSKGIFIQCVAPYFVATKMSKVRKGNLLIPYPNVFVKNALKTVGIDNKTHGYMLHNLMGWLSGALPWLANKVAWSAFMGARARAKKKMQRKME